MDGRYHAFITGVQGKFRSSMKKYKEIVISVDANDDNSMTNNSSNEFTVKALYGTIETSELSFLTLTNNTCVVNEMIDATNIIPSGTHTTLRYQGSNHSVQNMRKQ